MGFSIGGETVAIRLKKGVSTGGSAVIDVLRMKSGGESRFVTTGVVNYVAPRSSAEYP
jgi:hypothetical protein